MASGYGRTLDVARKLNLPLMDLKPRMARMGKLQLAFGGKTMTREDWTASPANPFPAAFKAMMPWEVAPHILATANPLKDWSNTQAAQYGAKAAIATACRQELLVFRVRSGSLSFRSRRAQAKR
jgi:hypothetical protein